MCKRKSVIISVIIGVILVTAFVVAPRHLEINSIYAGDSAMWNHIFEKGDERPYQFAEKPLGVILPHHMIVAQELAKFYSGLGKVTQPTTVYVIGPNHYESGTANIQTCLSCLYKTTLAGLPDDLTVNTEMVSKLAQAEIATIANQSFEIEHAMFAHAPYIKRNFPNAQIVPIILQWATSVEEISKLSDWLSDNVSNDDLVIASVDFSHYISREAADFHDLSSFATIINFDFANIFDLEIDSRASIYTLLAFLKQRGYAKAERFAHTNLQDFMKVRQDRTTSHQFFGFFEGQAEPIKGVSILSFGNMPADDKLGLIDNWDWDRTYDQAGDTSVLKYLKDIKGEEDRFLTGSDFNVFDLEEGKCLPREQNGLVVSFCKFVENGVYGENVFGRVEAAKAAGDFVYLLYQFSGSELTDSRKRLAQKFVDSGVDVFVGRGIKELVPVERYHDGVLMYSLGDFITEDGESSVGEIVGVYLTEGKIDVYEFLVEVVEGRPRGGMGM